MKANYIGSKSDYNRIAMQVAREEVERQKSEICPACEQSIANQVMAMILKVLHDEYGFGKKRMLDVIDRTETLFSLCGTDSRHYNSLQAVEWLKSIGIDLEKGDTS